MADIGTTLREARMRARLDITEAERATKIRARYLRAIEHEEWEALPGNVYIKSFLRTYGDYLGLDSRMLVDEFKRRYERPSDHEPRSVATLHRERERAARGPLVPAWAPIGLVLIAVVVGLYFLGRGGSNSPPATTHPPVAHAVPAPAHHPRAAHPVAPRTVTLELVPTGQVYVCLVDGTGRKLIPGRIFAAGQTVPAQTSRKLLLTLGNASVRMKVNGKTMAIRPSTGSIGFQFEPRATTPLPASRQPRCA
jgi:cytoskeleton protein RodZ